MTHPSGAEHWMRRSPERIRRGAQANSAKLSAEQIDWLCSYYAANQPRQTWLAQQLGVSRMTIWRHLKAAGLVAGREV